MIGNLAAQANVRFLNGRTVAVLGYGAQGQAHALNLRDSGCQVIVAQRPGGLHHAAAVESGFEPVDARTAARRADILIFGLPDEAAPAVYEEQIRPELRSGQTLGFIHGFNIQYGRIGPPRGVDVVLVAPKAQGHAVRSLFLAGGGAVALVATGQDASGRAMETALGWAAGLGCHRSGILPTTFRDETETDLFGEQAVLCGGLTALIKAGFETLVEAGYPPELAYFECCHEVKLIVDLIYEGGLTYMRERISNTARFGDLTRGPRVVDEASRAAMRAILAQIRTGQFAREWLSEYEQGLPIFKTLTDNDRNHPIEVIGATLRGMLRPARPSESTGGHTGNA